MSKKILVAAFIALGALISTSASAVVTVSNPTQPVSSGDTVALPGGEAVRANDIALTLGGAGNIDPASTSTKTVTVRLPDGINFDGTPTFTVTQASAGVGFALKDSAGDPTLTDAGVTLSDTNGDGGMDRAQVSAAAANAAGDTLTISVNVKVGAAVVAKATAYQANVIFNTSVNPINLVKVVKDFAEPVYHKFTPVITAQNSVVNTSPTTSFIVTVPKGTKGGTTMTLTVGSKLIYSEAGVTSSTITATQLTPAKQTVFSAMSQTADNSGVKFLTFTVSGTTTYTVPDDTQVSLSLSSFGQTPTTTVTGLQGLTLAGAVSGKVNYIDIRKNGSSAALATGAKMKDIVVGSKASQTLPSISITENFDRDAVSAATQTITITPGTGLKLETATLSITGTGWAAVNAAATATISTKGVMTVDISNAAGGSLTVTIGQIKATASALGTLTLTVGKPGTDMPTAPSDTLNVATGVSVGTVSAGLKTGTTVATTGALGTGSSVIVMKETTYGSLSIAKKTATQIAYISVTSSSNSKLSSVSIAAGSGSAAYPSGTAPTFGNSGTCQAETVGSNVYICEVTAESSGITAGTSTIQITAAWSVNSAAEVGSDIVLTVDGNTGVAGEFKVGVVGLTTKVTVGQIPDIKPGSLTASSLAPVTITGLFANAVTTTAGATFRLLAPAGVAFQDAAATQASTSIGTATISSTFRPNDTLSLAISKTATITFTPKAIFSSDSASGLVSFDIVDGDINGKNLTLIAPATVELAYVDGTLEKLAAGKDGAVNVGFSVSNTVEGGLAPYTVASSATSIATPTISGSTVTVEGVAAGVATITVTDALGATDTYDVTVSAGAAEPAQGKATKASDGSESAATFTGGATIDGGTTYTDAITTADEVIINATINVDPEDVGEAGGIHAVVLSPAGLLMLESDGSWVPWDGVIAHVATYLEVDALAATYSVPLYNGAIATAGKWRFAVVYSTDTGKLVYTTKAAMITVSE